jgi:LmbE family N-acetylglucosaminyl deacetylase
VLQAQLGPPTTGGAVALDQALRFLGQYKRVLVIGAHPDDEDTELLTILTRGEGAEAAYLSLNRGEGGQNLVGSELGVALGMLRTEELLAARRLDGAGQYFTRAYDFGFSRNLDDTWAHWPRDTILKDVVRIVRRFRPQIIVSIFSGTPRDGHGQHQAAGWAAAEAFRLAGDSQVFPELQTSEGLAPWVPLKLYRSARFDTAATTLTLDGARIDTAAGKTYHQIAMASRSLHRSQDMGQLQAIGPSVVRLALVKDATGQGTFGFWGGIDTSLAALRASTGGTRMHEYRALIDSCRASPGDSLMTARLLRAARLLAPTAGMPWSQGRASPEVQDQLRHIGDAWQAASGTLLDVRSSGAHLAPGDTMEVLIEAIGVPLNQAPPAFRSAPLPLPRTPPQVRRLVAGGRTGLAWRHAGRVAPGRPLTQPYFLRASPPGNLYDWSAAAAEDKGLPFEAPEIVAGLVTAPLPVAWMWREGTWRWNDQARGEVREPVDIVPRVGVTLAPAELPWSTSRTSPETFTVTLVHGALDTTSGTVRLQLPEGWPAVPAQRFTLTRQNQRLELQFAVRAPAGRVPGTYMVRAIAEDAGSRRYEQGRATISYPYIRPRSYLTPATSRVTVLDLRLPSVKRVGYIRGAADRVPEALVSAGIPVDLIDGSYLVSGGLARYDAIVVGPRAYETDSSLVDASARLLAYARAGGLVIVQYQQYGFFFGNYAPFPLFVASRPPGSADRAVTTAQPASGAPVAALLGGHDRVTDEHAVVSMVDTAARVLRVPNRLGPADWDGWVQERGLYFAQAWAPEYRTVLEMHDPAEANLEGGLLIARVGKGTWVYTGLSFFRQLPAGVPGAYRLFANLLSLGTAGNGERGTGNR